MKKRAYIIKLLLLLLLFFTQRIVAGQTDITNKGVTITNLSDIYINGNYIHDSISEIANGGTIYFRKDITNTADNRIFITDAGKVVIDGELEQKITGDSIINFNKLEINKPSNNLILYQSIKVSDTLNLLIGGIDLNGNEVDLSNSGELINETNANRIYGSTGKIRARRKIESPKLSDNIGGLGIYLSSDENFSFATIERSHEQQINNGDTSIFRYYNFKPDSLDKIGLIDSLKLSYFDSEAIQGEYLYKIYSSINDGTDWRNKGGLVDASNNFVITTTFTPPAIGKFRASIFPIESFATCLPNDPDFISAVFLVSTDVTDGDSVKFIQLSSPDPGNYAWNFGDGNLSEEHSPFHIYTLSDPSAANQYQVTMTVTNGICSDTRKKNVLVNPEITIPRIVNLYDGIEYFNIYPNPNSGSFTMEVKTTEQSDIAIHVLDMQGRLMDRKIIRTSSYKEILNYENLSAGIYFIKLQVGEELRVVKMVKY